MTELYRIRLKAKPEVYVGKHDPTYAINEDGKAIDLSAHWFVPEPLAKAWTKSALRRVVAYACSEWRTATFTRFEVVDTKGVAAPLDSLLK